MKFIMVDGTGTPATEAFQQKVGVVYSLAYTLKFLSKKLLKKDYGVMALEGLWWIRGESLDLTRRKDWSWTLIVVPDFVTEKMFAEAKEEIRRKRTRQGSKKPDSSLSTKVIASRSCTSARTQPSPSRSRSSRNTAGSTATSWWGGTTRSISATPDAPLRPSSRP